MRRALSVRSRDHGNAIGVTTRMPSSCAAMRICPPAIRTLALRRFRR